MSGASSLIGEARQGSSRRAATFASISLLHSFRWFARAAGLGATLVGFVVLCGWLFDIASLKSVLPDLVAMKFNTALGFVLTGISLWLLAPDSLSEGKRGLRFAAMICAGLVALVGALTLSEYVFTWNAGIDQLLFTEMGPAVETSHLGRMAPITALNFLLLGLALLLMETSRRLGQLLRFFLATAVFLAAFLGLIGYAYGVRNLYALGSFTPIALHTTATFVLLSLGILACRLEQGPTAPFASDTVGGMMARRLFPAALLVPAILGWLRLQGEAHNLYGARFGVALFATSSAVVFAALVWLNTVALDKIDRQRQQAGRALEEQTSILRSILDSMGEAVVVHDKQGRFLVFNRAAERLFGRPATPPPMADWPRHFGFYQTDGVTPFTTEQIPSVRALQGESMDEVEMLVRSPGILEERWISVSARPVLDEGGNPVGSVAVCRDLTRRRRDEAALRKAAAEIQDLYDNAPCGYHSLDPDGVFLRMNDTELAWLGYARQEVVGKMKFLDVITPASRQTFAANFPQMRERGRVEGLEFEMVRKDGSTFPVLLSATALLDAQGRFLHTRTTVFDITERKRVQEALRRSEESYRSLVEHIPDVVWTADSEARASFISPNMEQLVGLTAEEITAGGPEVWFQRVHPEHAQRARDAYREMFATRLPLDIEYPIQRKDGRWIWVHVHADHVYEAEDRVFASGIVSDVTRQKQLEEDLRNLNAELARTNRELEQRSFEAEHATRLKSRFLASMSHELRTPLTAIIGFSDLLGEEIAGSLNPKQRRYVEHARQAARHLLQLINDILDLSKIEAGQLEFHPEAFAVAEALPEVLTTVRPLALARKVRLQTRVDTLRVFADRIRFKQILYNLISNAIKFTPQGGSVSVESAPHERFVEVSVTDTGIGIASDELEVIFEEFRQVGSSTRGVKEGTGLGLAITRRLVEQQGGTIRVESEPGKGSRFTFALPAAQPAEAPRDAVDNRPRASRRAQPLVLVIDDEPAARELLVEYLSPQGYALETAASGAEGLRKARELQPDAITLNMLMPGKNGWEALRELKADSSTASIPVIIVSVVDQKNMGFALGAAEYLVKPVAKQVLLQAVRKWLPRTDGRPAILVVDDEPQALQMMAEVLEAAGYRITKASGGREALEAIRRDPPHGLLLDLLMPEVDGFEVIRQMKEDSALRDIPVFVLTAKDLTDQDVEFLRVETRAFFRKSASWKQELLAQVRAAVARSAEAARP
jgi:PAS domain S-box-containing protein